MITNEFIFADNYKLLKKLGQGGMGSVYLAQDLKTEKNVALKTLVLESVLDDETRENSIYNFKREARALSKLNHTNIVNLYGFGQENENLHYIVMELIDGQPVSKILGFHPLPVEIVLSIAIQIGDALAYIHRNGVIHRDVKTENIMLLGKGLAKLTDFGIAKFSGDAPREKTDENDYIMGTILYMSPEQLNSPNNVDGRADLYSFAITLYEMLTGRLPLQSDTINGAIMKVLKEKPMPPSKYNSMLPKSFDNLIMKALEKDRDLRHQNMDEFIEELRCVNEYKHFIEMKELQFARDFGSIKTVLNKGDIKEAIIKGQDSTEDLEEVTEDNSNGLFVSADLSWVDNLDFLVDEANKLKDEKSNVIESLSYITPIINSEQIKNLVLSAKNLKNTKEVFDFLNIFDGVKSLKQVIEKSANANVFDTFIECASKNILPDEVLHVVNALNLVVEHQHQMKTLLDLLKYTYNPKEILSFLGTVRANKKLREIIDENYSLKEIAYIFDMLHLLCEKGILSLKIAAPPENLDILIGDMLVKFSTVTRAQLSFAIKEKDKPEHKNKQIGEILVQLGFITKEKFMNILKIQLWYKGFFTKKQ